MQFVMGPGRLGKDNTNISLALLFAQTTRHLLLTLIQKQRLVNVSRKRLGWIRRSPPLIDSSRNYGRCLAGLLRLPGQPSVQTCFIYNYSNNHFADQ